MQGLHDQPLCLALILIHVFDRDTPLMKKYEKASGKVDQSARGLDLTPYHDGKEFGLLHLTLRINSGHVRRARPEFFGLGNIPDFFDTFPVSMQVVA